MDKKEHLKIVVSMKEESWLQNIRERLRNHVEPLPPSGWQRLEQELSMGTGKGKKHVFMLRRYVSVVAAAVLLVALSGISVWLLNTPAVEGLQRDVLPATTLAVPDELLPVRPADRYVEHPSQARVDASATVSRGQWVASLETKATGEHPEDIDSNSFSLPEEATSCEETGQQEVEEHAGEKERERQERHRSLPPSSDFDRTDNVAKKRTGWSVALSAGNAGGVGTVMNGSNEGVFLQSSPDAAAHSGMNLCSAGNVVSTVPEGQEILYKGSVSYLSGRHQIAHIKHRQPVSVGVTFRKNLPKRFSVETGLVYTLLSSEVTFEEGTRQLDQKLHYLGIPLRANWNFWERSSFMLYVSGGGMVEKCIYGKLGSEKATVRPLQFSVTASVGAQYNLSRHLGIYFEPGFAYFFDDGSDFVTIRKDNPANFTLQAGVRLMY